MYSDVMLCSMTPGKDGSTDSNEIYYIKFTT